MMVMVEHLKKGDWIKAHYFASTITATVLGVDTDDERTIIKIDAREADTPRFRNYMNGTPLQTERTEEALYEISKQQLRKLAGTL